MDTNVDTCPAKRLAGGGVHAPSATAYDENHAESPVGGWLLFTLLQSIRREKTRLHRSGGTEKEPPQVVARAVAKALHRCSPLYEASLVL